MLTLIIVGIIAVLLIFWFSTYNSLVKYSNWVEESWSQIDVQLKRRYDLIPNLVETVKGYARHEQETLAKVIQARNASIQNADSREKVMDMNDQLSGALKSIFALGESYPELKANQNFLMLQEEIASTENKIAYARQLYNTTTVKYNTKIQSVPTNIVANAHKFTKKSLLEAKTEERENVKISF